MIRSATELAPTSEAAGQTTRTPNNLGQQDFLTLLTTQLRNQDPLNPMQNTEFLGQMAQFSTVAGIDRLHDGVQALGTGFRDMRMGMASHLVGQSVLVPGAKALPDTSGAYRGVVDLQSSAQDVEIIYADAVTGAVLHRQILGPHAKGPVEFAWQNAPAERVAIRQPMAVSANVLNGGVAESAAIRVYAQVQSATLGQGADDITFDVEGFGKLHSLEIETIR